MDEAFEGRWQGFVKLIVPAYFAKRMAWYPLDKLRLEQLVLRTLVLCACWQFSACHVHG